MKTPEELAKEWIANSCKFSCNCEQCNQEFNIEAFKAGFIKGFALGASTTAENIIIESIKATNEKNI